MKLRQRILRMLFPSCENERMQFRMAMNCASAHAEDLSRTACLVVEDLSCTGRKPAPDKGSKPT